MVHTTPEHADDNTALALAADSGYLQPYIQKLEERLAVKRLHPKDTQFAERGELDTKELTTITKYAVKDKHKSDEWGEEDDDDDDDEEEEEGEWEEEEEEEEKTTRPIVAMAQKLNYFNFFHRFPHQTELPVVEALMVNSTLEQMVEQVNAIRLEGRSSHESEKTVLTEMESHITSDAWMARIRINSTPLVREIVDVLDPDTHHGASLVLRLVFLHPFEPLVSSYTEFKERLEKLQNDVQSGQDEVTTAENAKNYELLTMMEVFVRFIEEEIIPIFSTKSTKFLFASLPAIFNLGETIYVPDTKPWSMTDPEALKDRRDQRLWRLYGIERSHKEGSLVLEDTGSLVLKTYAIDYDGEKYVCQKKTISIPAYKGEKEVVNLPAFPLRYIHTEKARKIENDARKYGEMFVQYQDQKPKLLAYNGWALDVDPKTEAPLHYVTSDIVVDTAETFKSHSGWMPEWEFPEHPAPMANPWSHFISEWFISRGEYARIQKEDQIWFELYFQIKTSSYYASDPFVSHWFKNDEKKYQLQDRDLELLPDRIFAYILQDRRFLAVNIRNMKEISDEKINMRHLIIKREHKSLLRALIQAHFQRKDLQKTPGMDDINQDIIENKGRGLIILLYGVPGVGKTSTAEMIARKYSKPLLPITCGDLGTKAVEVENKLRDLFRLAQKWDCILLLDEAEVFLAERTPTSLDRNALVSVFLRQLEYYAGIIFLTTNLPGGIDEAFKSRIHASLYYPHLEEDASMKIWDVNIKRLQEFERARTKFTNEEPLTIDQVGVMDFAKKQFRKNENGKGRWNGRQIRNAFLIASALAQFEKDKSSVHGRRHKDLSFDIHSEHLEVVAEASSAFERYLVETRGRTFSELMFQRGQRADFISHEHLAESSLPTTHGARTQDDREFLGTQSTVYGHRDRSYSPGLYAQQNHAFVNMTERQQTYAGNQVYGGHGGYTASSHYKESFSGPLQHHSGLVESNSHLSSEMHPVRHGELQDSPSQFSPRQSALAHAPAQDDTDSE